MCHFESMKMEENKWTFLFCFCIEEPSSTLANSGLHCRRIKPLNPVNRVHAHERRRKIKR
jgi:hypothetical protein